MLVFFVVARAGAADARWTSQLTLASQIAGNIVLFLFALTMIFGESKLEEDEKLLRTSDLERAVYPLAIPSIASPGAMLTVMTVTDNSSFSIPEQAETVLSGRRSSWRSLLVLMLVRHPASSL